jgi:hypothetical protein
VLTLTRSLALFFDYHVRMGWKCGPSGSPLRLLSGCQSSVRQGVSATRVGPVKITLVGPPTSGRNSRPPFETSHTDHHLLLIPL